MQTARLIALTLLAARADGYGRNDEARFVSEFADRTRYSYVAPLPADVASRCKNKGKRNSFREVTVSGAASSSEIAAQCGADALCVVEGTVAVDGGWDVGALIVKGELVVADGAWLCAGYVVAEGAGVIRVEDAATIFIKNNGAVHPILRARAFGSVATRGASEKPLVDVRGRPLDRTWSLLAAPAYAGATSLELLHDVQAAGWRVGDRIAVAPTVAGPNTAQRSNSESSEIVGIAGNVVTISQPLMKDKRAEFEATATHAIALAAEVINLSRDVLITGDDFEEVPCDPSLAPGSVVVNGFALPTSDFGESHWAGCMCTSVKSSCTMGLHTKMIGGGAHVVSNARIEKCGQRGVFGKYCAHWHEVGECEDCLFENNAVEFGVQRGLIVHNTHLATVRGNVFHDVRGPALYCQDGLEMWNRFEHNVAICNHRWEDGSCAIPGTDNDQADTSTNLAAFWTISPTQDLIGNRFANYHNGYMVEADGGFLDGMGRADGRICAGGLSVARVEGNTFHGHGRFGTYFIGENYPVQTARSLRTGGATGDGGTRDGSCAAFDEDGLDRGLPCQLAYNVDWGNNFVFTYLQGDVQYAHQASIESSNGVYWKTTKSFADGCSSHIKDSLIDKSGVRVPDTAGAFIMENVDVRGYPAFIPHHHCNTLDTGMLCSATYVFDEVRGKFGSVGKVDTALYRGALVLAPGQTSNDNFPPGYVAAADGTYGSYLLAHPDCDRADATGGEYADRFGGATVLCRRTLRVVKIYAFDGWNGPGQLQVRLTFPGGQSDFPIDRVNINNRHRAPPWLEGARNGFAFPVLVGDGVEYEIFGDVPDDWIIDFSDPIFGNRWPADELELAVGGRDCPAKIRSTHDRRFVFASPSTSLLDRARGRGACTAHPPMPAVDCAAVSLGLDECPELCGNCPGDSYCRCGVGQCVCPPGRSGPNCAPDLACDRGQPVARFLGPGSVVAEHACVCDEGWTGAACDFNACAGVDCSGRGECRATEDGDWTCECEPDYLGRNCQHTCKDHCGNHDCGLWVPTGYCEPGGTCWYIDSDPPQHADWMAPFGSSPPAGSDWCQYVGDLEDDGPFPSREPTPPTRRPTPRPTEPRPTPEPSLPQPTREPTTSQPSAPRCGVSSCTADVWVTMAGDHPCGNRIDWVKANLFKSEADACRQIAVDEFPAECGGCAPDESGPGPAPSPPEPSAEPSAPPADPAPTPTVADSAPTPTVDAPTPSVDATTLFGVNYATGLMSDANRPTDYASKLSYARIAAARGVCNIKIWDSDPELLAALRDAYTEAGLGDCLDVQIHCNVPCVLECAGDVAAARALVDEVAPFPFVTSVAVGNELDFAHGQPTQGVELDAWYALPAAMSNLHGRGLALCSPLSAAIQVPRNGDWNDVIVRPEKADVFRDMLEFVDYVSFNPYPLFAYAQEQGATWQAWVVGQDDSGTYAQGTRSMLEAQLMNMRHAICDNSPAHCDLPMVVGESGWASGGSDYGTPEMACAFYTNALADLAAGTFDQYNLLPGKFYLFELFDEKNKPGIGMERHFGILNEDGSAKDGLTDCVLAAAAEAPPPPDDGDDARCGVRSCTPEVLATIATGSNAVASCGDRIAWVMDNLFKSEEDACRQIAVDEFAAECGACDPDASDPGPAPSPEPSDPPSFKPTADPSAKPTPRPSPEPTAPERVVVDGVEYVLTDSCCACSA